MMNAILAPVHRTLRLTKEQQRAVLRLHERSSQDMSFLAFRRTVHPIADRSGGVMVYWVGMWIGIERDGYTHS